MLEKGGTRFRGLEMGRKWQFMKEKKIRGREEREERYYLEIVLIFRVNLEMESRVKEYIYFQMQ